MIFKQSIEIPKTFKVVEHYVAPCLKCGRDELDIREHEDNAGPPLAFVECKNKAICGNKVKVTGFAASAIKEWNKQNDPATMILEATQLIADTKIKIAEYKAVLRLREREAKKKTYANRNHVPSLINVQKNP